MERSWHRWFYQVGTTEDNTADFINRRENKQRHDYTGEVERRGKNEEKRRRLTMSYALMLRLWLLPDAATGLGFTREAHPQRPHNPVTAFRFPQTPPGYILISNTKYEQILIRPPVQLWFQTTAIVNQTDRRLIAAVVNCCKLSATVGTCCSQLSSVVYRRSQSRRSGEPAFFRMGDILVC